MMQFAISADRSLPGRSTVSVNFVDTRGIHDQRTRNINAFLPGTYDSVLRTGGRRPFAGGDIYSYESTGVYRQRQIVVNASTRFNKHFTMQGYYAYGRVNSNVNGFPSNQYDTSVDYGRAGYDIRHRINFGGQVGLPLKLSLAPLVTITSPAPFNITTGTDFNGDGIINDRPSFATSASNAKNVKVTQWGTFNAAPVAGETIIPVNYGTGFEHITANLRLSRSFGWGERPGSNANGGGSDGGGPGGFSGGRGGGGDRGGGGGPRGGGGFGGGRGGGFGGFGGGGTGKKYNLTMTISARNALNRVNYANPQGSLNSPAFGRSLAIGDGGGRGGGGASGNRKVELQLRFQF